MRVESYKSKVESELSSAITRLREVGVESPQLDAQLMMAHALGCSRIDVIAHPERVLSAQALATFRAILDKRASRFPLAHILGVKEFFGLEFIVSPAVLIPRPETEILVEECLNRVGDAPVIADIGTGSGAIAVALAVNIPNARVWATDSSEEALKVARANVEKHGVADRVSIVRGDLLEPLIALADGQGHHVPAQQRGFDAIVSNPPYIPSGVIESLEPEVRREPREALDGGIDGLDAYRRLFSQAVGLAKRASSLQESFLEGFIAVEIGIEQAAPVTQIAKAAGWTEVRIIRDLAGIERVAIARQ